ncbi:MAG: Lar family restriction alleviation protein [Bacilli bacterium]|nr:Lar family restriction alleviation protein [Bacilli bacterium]
MRNELLKGLSKEQIAKAKACKNQEELLVLAKAEGIELTDEQLELVNGGFCSETTEPCPKCGSKSIIKEHRGNDVHMHTVFICKKCGCEWDPD